MNQTITIFTYEANTNIRTVVTEDGTPLFCGKDVAITLGYTNPNKAIHDHCKGVPFRYPLETPGGTQQARFITEGDLYRLVFNSKLPEAEKFEAWVVDEVLPSIRKHGMYATESVVDAMLADPEAMIRTLTTLKEERAAGEAGADQRPQSPLRRRRGQTYFVNKFLTHTAGD